MDSKTFKNTFKGLSLLKCLCTSLSDTEGRTLVKRHLVLMGNYLQMRKHGIRSVDIPYLRIALEFFSLNISDQEYCRLLCHCLKLLQKPILFLRAAFNKIEIDNFSIFFSSLGNCLHLNGENAIHCLIIDTISFLMTYKEQKPDEISLEIRLEALEKSHLAEAITAYMYFAPIDIYNSVLDVMYQLSLFPSFANFFLSLKCMDFWIRRIPIKNTLSIRESSVKEITSNLLWAVLRCPDISSDAMEFATLNSESLSVLRGWLRRETLFGLPYERNNVAALILQIFLTFPTLKISRSGIIEDIGILAVATEFGTDNTWANRIKFKSTNEDLQFKIILLTISLVMFDDHITKMVIVESRFLSSLALLLDIRNYQGYVKWNKSQHLELINVSLFALPIISVHYKKEYTMCGATVRILELISYFAYKELNLQLVSKCCLTLHLLVAGEISLKHFRTMNVVGVLLDLIFFILENFPLSLLVQTILANSLYVITTLAEDHVSYIEDYGEDVKNLSLKILKRIENPTETDSKILSSFLVCLSDFIWQTTISNDKTRNLFIDNLGVYLILNLLEDSHILVQISLLGMLCDICLEPRCLPQIVTWRGKNQNNSFLRTVCLVWREQEHKKGVRRDKKGCIEDIELCLMGERQHSKEINFIGSPSLVDMIACARPKIATLIDLLTRRHYEKVQLVEKVYCIPFGSIGPEDQITLQIIKCYEELKEGEILWEIQEAVNKSNLILLPIDTTVIHELVMHQVGLANKIQKDQRQILPNFKKGEIYEEQKLYNEIRDVKLTNELKSIFEKDRYLMVSNEKYKRLKHKKYETFLNEIKEQFKIKLNERNFHQTFSEPIHFVLVKTGRNAHIRSINRKKTYSSILYQNILDYHENK